MQDGIFVDIRSASPENLYFRVSEDGSSDMFFDFPKPTELAAILKNDAHSDKDTSLDIASVDEIGEGRVKFEILKDSIVTPAPFKNGLKFKDSSALSGEFLTSILIQSNLPTDTLLDVKIEDSTDGVIISFYHPQWQQGGNSSNGGEYMIRCCERHHSTETLEAPDCEDIYFQSWEAADSNGRISMEFFDSWRPAHVSSESGFEYQIFVLEETELSSAFPTSPMETSEELPLHCGNGIKDFTETGIDVGGDCVKEISCTEDSECRINGDSGASCSSGACVCSSEMYFGAYCVETCRTQDVADLLFCKNMGITDGNIVYNNPSSGAPIDAIAMEIASNSAGGDCSLINEEDLKNIKLAFDSVSMNVVLRNDAGKVYFDIFDGKTSIDMNDVSFMMILDGVSAKFDSSLTNEENIASLRTIFGNIDLSITTIDDINSDLSIPNDATGSILMTYVNTCSDDHIFGLSVTDECKTLITDFSCVMGATHVWSGVQDNPGLCSSMSNVDHLNEVRSMAKKINSICGISEIKLPEREGIETGLLYQSLPEPSTCNNGVKDGDETGLDCGGSCDAICMCESDADCRDADSSATCDTSVGKCVCSDDSLYGGFRCEETCAAQSTPSSHNMCENVALLENMLIGSTSETHIRMNDRVLRSLAALMGVADYAESLQADTYDLRTLSLVFADSTAITGFDRTVETLANRFEIKFAFSFDAYKETMFKFEMTSSKMQKSTLFSTDDLMYSKDNAMTSQSIVDDLKNTFKTIENAEVAISGYGDATKRSQDREILIIFSLASDADIGTVVDNQLSGYSTECQSMMKNVVCHMEASAQSPLHEDIPRCNQPNAAHLLPIDTCLDLDTKCGLDKFILPDGSEVALSTVCLQDGNTCDTYTNDSTKCANQEGCGYFEMCFETEDNVCNAATGESECASAGDSCSWAPERCGSVCSSLDKDSCNNNDSCSYADADFTCVDKCTTITDPFACVSGQNYLHCGWDSLSNSCHPTDCTAMNNAECSAIDHCKVIDATCKDSCRGMSESDCLKTDSNHCKWRPFCFEEYVHDVCKFEWGIGSPCEICLEKGFDSANCENSTKSYCCTTGASDPACIAENLTCPDDWQLCPYLGLTVESQCTDMEECTTGEMCKLDSENISSSECNSLMGEDCTNNVECRLTEETCKVKSCDAYETKDSCSSENHCIWDANAHSCNLDLCNSYDSSVCSTYDHCSWNSSIAKCSLKDCGESCDSAHCSKVDAKCLPNCNAFSYSKCLISGGCETLTPCHADCASIGTDKNSCNRFDHCIWRRNQCYSAELDNEQEYDVNTCLFDNTAAGNPCDSCGIENETCMLAAHEYCCKGDGIFDAYCDKLSLCRADITFTGVNSLNEGAQMDVSFTLVSRPKGDVTVTFDDLEITNDDFITVEPNQVTFTKDDWNIAKNIVISAVEDNIDFGADMHLSGTVTLSSTDDSRYLDVPSTLSIQVEDNDVAGVSLSRNAINVDEQSPDVTAQLVTLTFNTKLHKPVTITPNGFDEQLIVEPSTITIDPLSGDDTHAVDFTIKAIRDDILGEDEVHDITVGFSAESEDYVFKTLSFPEVVVSIKDYPPCKFDESITNAPCPTCIERDSSECIEEGEMYCCSGDGFGVDSACDTVSCDHTLNLVSPTMVDKKLSIAEGEIVPLKFATPSKFSGSRFLELSMGYMQTGVYFENYKVEITPDQWDQVITMEMEGQSNDSEEADKTVNVNAKLFESDGVTLISSHEFEVTIINDDFRSVDSSHSVLTLKEEGSPPVDFTLSLGSSPMSDVVVTIDNAGGQVTVSPDRIVFSEHEWNKVATVAVSAVDEGDDEEEIEHMATLTISTTSLDDGYNTVEDITMELRIMNAAADIDETPAPIFESVIESETEEALILSFSKDSTMMGITADVVVTQCSKLKIFDESTNAVLGTDFGCMWINPKQLKVILGTDYTATTDTTITLRGAEIRATEASINASFGSLKVVGRTPAPEAVSARLNGLGSEIVITFEGDLYQPIAGRVDSEVLFRESEMFGVGSKVYFSASKVLNVVLTPSATIRFANSINPANLCPEGFAVKFKDGAINPVEDSINSVQGCLSVLASLNPVTPSVDFIGPETVGTCDDVKLTASGSGGGIKELEFTWSVESLSGMAYEELLPLREILIAASSNNAKVVEIPKEKLEGGKSYEFKITVTSYAGAVVSKTVKITKDALAIPVISSLQAKELTMTTLTQKRLIAVRASPPVCGSSSGNLASNLAYSWSLMSGNLPDGVTMSDFKSNSDREIILVGSKLKALETYTFRVTVKMAVGLSFVQNSSTFTVTVEASDLQVILGGDRDISAISPIFIDASGCSDPDNLAGNLQFNWSCLKTSDNTDCGIDLNNYTDSTGAKLTVPARTLSADDDNRYKIAVNVSKDTRSKDVEFNVLVTSVIAPSVQISSTLIAGVPFTTSNKLTLNALPESEYDGYSLEWYLIGDKTIQEVAASAINKSKLIIGADKLTDGSNYEIGVKIVDLNGSNSATLAFETNTAPTGGVLSTSTALTGEVMSFTFSFSTEGWNDLNTPLEYKFGAIDTITGIETVLQGWSSRFVCETNKLSTGVHQIVAYARDSEYAVAQTEVDKNGETIIVTVTDLVVPVDQNRSEFVMQQTSSQLAAAKKSGDAEEILALASQAVAAFRDPCLGVICGSHGSCGADTGACVCTDGYTGLSCSTPPPVDGAPSDSWSEWTACSASCGGGIRTASRECDNPAPMYGGDECVDTDLVKQEACNVDPCVMVINGGYSDFVWGECSADCSNYPQGGMVKGTRDGSRTCTNPSPSDEGLDCSAIGAPTSIEACIFECPNIVPPKLCPGSTYDDVSGEFLSECSGQGSCIRKKGETTVGALQCRQGDMSCSVQCECNEGFDGKACLYTAADMTKMRTNAKSLLNTIALVADKVTDEVMNQQADTLVAVTADQDMLDSEGASIATGIVSSMLNTGSVLDTTSGVQLLNALSSAFQVQSDDTETDTTGQNETRDVVDKVASNLLGSMEDNENTMFIKTDAFAMNVQSRTKEDLTSSPFEVQSDEYSQPMAIGMPSTMTDEIGATGSVQVKAVQWSEDPNAASDGTALETPVLSLKLAGEGSDIDVNSLTIPLEFSFWLHHTNVDAVECTYYAGDGKYMSTGMTLLNVEVYQELSSMHVTCGTTHLTDLSAKSGDAVPEMNLVDPIGDASLLLSYNWSNATPIYVLGGIGLFFIFSCVFSAWRARVNRNKYIAAQKKQFLEHGTMTAPKKGLSTSILGRVADGFRHKHSWGSIVAPTLQEQVTLSRIQRLTVTAAVTYTAIAVNAAFYGNDPESIEQQVGMVFISALTCLPASIIFPMLFRKVNSFYSRTVMARKAEKKAMKKKVRARKRAEKLRKKRERQAIKNGSLPETIDEISVSSKEGKVGLDSLIHKKAAPSAWLPIDAPKPQNPVAPCSDEEEIEPVSAVSGDSNNPPIVNVNPPLPDLEKFENPMAAMNNGNVPVAGGSPQLPPLHVPGAEARRRASLVRELPGAVVPNKPILAPLKTNDLMEPSKTSNTSPTLNVAKMSQKPLKREKTLADVVMGMTGRKSEPLTPRGPSPHITKLQTSDSRLKVYQKIFLGLLAGILLATVFGFSVSSFNYSNEPLGEVFHMAQSILIVGVAFDCMIGFIAFYKKNRLWMEIFGAILMVLLMFMAALTVFLVMMDMVEVLGLFSETLMKSSWKSLYNSAQTNLDDNKTLMDIQNNGQCCGFGDLDDNPLLPCPIAATDGCQDYVTEEFKDANTWFVFFTILLATAGITSISLVSRLSEAMRERLVFNLNVYDERVARAAYKLQAAFRGWKGRAMAVRQRELDAWGELHKNRVMMKSMVYTIIVLYTLFMLYINLLYGIKFSDSITNSWLACSVMAVLLDVCMQQPLMIIGEALFAPMFRVLYDKVLGFVAEYLNCWEE
eukprot:TRINITY_DN1727_c0_g1_i7.p1 TRINITY_DN1727_c0_g1~~TRINITY_DN1727_c0_g1_i7.p1  ORF type:complete len:3929 (+),score=1599.98 TRINITY_DN1727_c0_g1_i7:991-12777(+)